MKIKSIEIQGMHNVTRRKYELSDITYFVGNNGAGKTTVLEAIQLALLGYIPGCSKNTSDIFAHSNSPTMSVELHIHDGDSLIKVTRTWMHSSKTIKTGVDIQPEGYEIKDIIESIELPIFNFAEFNSMSANKQKDWFINFLPSADSTINWEQELKSAVEGMPTSAIQAIYADVEGACSRLSGKGVDKVRELNNWIKSAITFKKSEINRLQGTIQSLLHYDDVDTSESIETLQAQHAELRRRSEAVSQYRFEKMQFDNYQADLSAATMPFESYTDDPSWVKLNEESARLTKRSEELNQHIQDLTEQCLSAQHNEQEEKNILQSEGVCPYTKCRCESIETLCTSAKQRLDAYSTTCYELRSNISKADVELRNIQHKLEEIRRESYRIINNYLYYQDLKHRNYVLPQIDESWLGVDYNKQIEDVVDKLSKLHANEKYDSMMQNITNAKYTAEMELDALKAWDKLTGPNGLQTKLAEKPFKDLESQMNPCIQSLFGTNCTASFYLSDKSNSFNFGIIRDNSYIAFRQLSSGEKCMYMLALFASMLSIQKTPLKVVIMDDVLDHLDDANLSAVFSAMKKLKDIQFILAGVKMYSDSSINLTAI